ncbi:hypothetical protein Tco_0116642 [Tanacetum coccineum]
MLWVDPSGLTIPVIMLNFEGWKLDGYQADGRSCVVLKMVLVGQVIYDVYVEYAAFDSSEALKASADPSCYPMEKMIADRVAQAIEDHEKKRASSGCCGFNTMDGKDGASVCGTCKCAEQKIGCCKQLSHLSGRALTCEGMGNSKEMTFMHYITTEFHELSLMCPELVPTEKKKIKKFIKGFPERIKGNITSSRPTSLHDAVNMARELVEQSVQGKAARSAESGKRKWDDNRRNNQGNNNNNRNRNNQQPSNKRHETTKVMRLLLLS